MKVFVLCGGEGTRLRPLTYTVPKSMLLIGNRPLLQFVVENLKQNNLTDIIFTVGYKHEQITRYFGDGSKFSVHIEYLIEETPQNTAGSVLPYKGKINDTFVVVMGDHITNAPIEKMIDFHKQKKTIATIGLLKHATKIDFGVVKTSNNLVTEFAEKPVIENLINIGMYVFEPEVFDFIKEKEDFAKNVFPKLLQARKKIAGFVTDAEWNDVGRLSDYEKLKEQYEKK